MNDFAEFLQEEDSDTKPYKENDMILCFFKLVTGDQIIGFVDPNEATDTKSLLTEENTSFDNLTNVPDFIVYEPYKMVTTYVEGSIAVLLTKVIPYMNTEVIELIEDHIVYADVMKGTLLDWFLLSRDIHKERSSYVDKLFKEEIDNMKKRVDQYNRNHNINSDNDVPDVSEDYDEEAMLDFLKNYEPSANTKKN